MSERTRVDDMAELTGVALDVLQVALNRGSKRYGPGSWLDESENHLGHADGHVRSLLAGIDFLNGEDQEANAICRLLMRRGRRMRRAK